MSLKRQRLGKEGENRCVQFLSQEGYRILERNWRCRFGEIDFVARQGQTLAFIEVKTRENLTYGEPQESVNWRKQRKIIAVALCYLRFQKTENQPIRFDVIAVTPEKIEIFPNAFQPESRYSI